MQRKKIKNGLGVIKNPIGIIGLFLVLIEAIAAFVIVKSSLPCLLNLILIIFIVVFPFAVLVVFYLLVTKHHEKLYSPSDYKDESNFVKTYNSVTRSEEIIEVGTCDKVESAVAKEGMTIEDINLIKDSLNTIVAMQKTLTQKNKKDEKTAIVEHVEKIINERLESYVTEKEMDYKISVSNIYGSSDFVSSLNSKGYNADIYFGYGSESTSLKKNSEHEAIWLGKNVSVSFAIELIKMAKDKFPHLKYIDYPSSDAPEYVNYQIYIGGATSTAKKHGLKIMQASDFEKIYECKSQEELYNYITNMNIN